VCFGKKIILQDTGFVHLARFHVPSISPRGYMSMQSACCLLCLDESNFGVKLVDSAVEISPRLLSRPEDSKSRRLSIL
jgi:hypothetical protein